MILSGPKADAQEMSQMNYEPGTINNGGRLSLPDSGEQARPRRWWIMAIIGVIAALAVLYLATRPAEEPADGRALGGKDHGHRGHGGAPMGFTAAGLTEESP